MTSTMLMSAYRHLVHTAAANVRAERTSSRRVIHFLPPDGQVMLASSHTASTASNTMSASNVHGLTIVPNTMTAT